MKFTITLQDEGEKAGKIYPPLLQITYADVPATSYGTGATVQASEKLCEIIQCILQGRTIVHELIVGIWPNIDAIK